MSAAATDPDLDDLATFADEARWELDTLKELGELGMRLARSSVAEAEVLAAAPEARQPAKAPHPVQAFSRISRAVRLTVMLHARIREGGLARDGRTVAKPATPLAPAAVPADADAEAALEDRRMTGRLRRSMARFIAGTAIEALEREAPETERLFEALDERLDREGRDDADFADHDVKDLAVSICRDLGVDPGPEWWADGWGIASDPSPVGGRMGPTPKEREDGVTDLSENSADARAQAFAPP